MSNDISTSAQRPPVAQAPAQATNTARPAEAIRPPPAETPKPVVSKPDPKEQRRALEEATEHLNKQMTLNKRDLSFSVDDVSNKVVVTVKNREGEVVRQIPSEAALRVAHNLDGMKGLLQDVKS